MRLFSILILMQLSFLGWSQQLDHEKHDFGKVSEWDNPMAEFVFTNTSGKEIVFLPTSYNRYVRVVIENKKLSPGQSTKIWVQYYTEKGGKFQVDVPIYINIQGEPITLTVVGNIRSFSSEALTVCPSMDGSGTTPLVESHHKIEVRDAETGAIIPKFDIRIANHSGTYRASEDNGVHEIRNFKPDLYDLQIESEGYTDKSEVIYLNTRSSVTVIYLQMEPVPIVPEQPLDTQVFVQVTPPIDEADTLIEEVIVEIVPDPIPDADTAISQEDLVDGKLNDGKYKFNNIVFLIDVSGSMGRNEKLSMLKYSMYRMIEVLRPEDKVSIVTYSSEISVLVSGVSGAEKELLKTIIFNLEASGQSYGSEGVDKAYEIALEHYIENGNNEIILASDGKINSVGFSENKLFRKVRRNYRKHGILFSSLGFGTNSPSLVFMEEMAVNGKGSFLRIGDEEMAKNALIENIMLHSVKDLKEENKSQTESNSDWYMSE